MMHKYPSEDRRQEAIQIMWNFYKILFWMDFANYEKDHVYTDIEDAVEKLNGRYGK